MIRHVVRLAALSLILIVATGTDLVAQSPKVKPPCLHGCGGGASPAVTILGTTFTPVTRAPQSGPFTYTITVENSGDTAGTFTVSCTTQAQLPCVTPSPVQFTLNAGGQQVVTVGYSTNGLGHFHQSHDISVTAGGDFVSVPGPNVGPAYFSSTDTILTVGLITVSGTAIGSIVKPLSGGTLATGDTIRANYSFSGGSFDTTSYRLFLDGGDITSTSHRTPTSIYKVGNKTLGGAHSFAAYGCLTTGRCDTIPAVVATVVAPPTTFELDDSLPQPVGHASGQLPGGLPLPPDSLKGCPLTTDSPDMQIVDPTSFVDQLTGTQGFIFLATANDDTTLHIITNYHDHKPTDGVTCDSYTYLQPSSYNYSFWNIPASAATNLVWSVYPYGDLAGGGSGFAMVRGPLGGTAGSGSTSGQLAGGNTVVGAGAPPPPLQNPGAINPNSLDIWLNGVEVVINGVAQGPYVHVNTLDILDSDVNISEYHGSMHRLDTTNPAADSGGWNTLVVSIADSTGHRTKIRARFAQYKHPLITNPNPPIAALPLTPLRNFGRLSQGDCAAFAAFQCDGAMFVQSLPGFVTRDKDRALHLVYRSGSQRSSTILPYSIFVHYTQAVPDSLIVTPFDHGAAAGPSLHYFAATPPTNGWSGEQTVPKLKDVQRVVGVELSPPTSGDAAIRSIQTVLQAIYDTGVAHTPVTHYDTVSQEVVQLYQTDTTAPGFGAGWTLAEQSRLIFGQLSLGDTAAIWQDGDGSFTIFRIINHVWTSPAGETAKLLDSARTAGLAARYVVSLSNGATIGFRADGRQQFTADLVGNHTTYFYDASNRLDSIADPSGMKYVIRYNVSGFSRLVSDLVMRAPTGDTARVASFGYDAGGKLLTKVRIWRTSTKADSTRFGYLVRGTSAYLDTIADPRSDTVRSYLRYDTLETLLPVTFTRPPDRFGTASLTFRHWWRRAVPRDGLGHGGLQAAERLIDPSQLLGTEFNYNGVVTDVAVDPFGNPTDVIQSPGGGSYERLITRDSIGRVLTITEEPDSGALARHVTYHYNGYSQVDTLIRSTLAYPETPGLDTITYVYDSVTSGLPVGGSRCSRLLSMKDPYGSVESVAYGTSGAAFCLPANTTGFAGDKTQFSYGTLSPGHPWGVRPVSVTDPTHLTMSATYDTHAWNTQVTTRASDNAASTAYYNPFGLPDSTKDPIGVRTFFRRDVAGRVYVSKTGKGTTAPTVRTYFNADGLADSIDVFGSGDAFGAGQDTVPLTTVQRTRNYYNLLGYLDSTVTPGARHHHFLRDRIGNPLWEYPGNGTYIFRVYDALGLLDTMFTGPVTPSAHGIDGLPFADPATLALYQSYNLPNGSVLNNGQGHGYDYDHKERLIRTRDSVATHRMVLSRNGAVITDTMTFTDGLTVVRGYTYNRRGQRTLAADTNFVANDRSGSEQYYYDTARARLDSIVSTSVTIDSGAKRVAKVRFVYDTAGRTTLRGVLLGGAGTEIVTTYGYDASGRQNSVQTVGTQTWYTFGSPSYNLSDQLLVAATTEPTPAGGLMNYGNTSTYDTAGQTGRLLHSARTGTQPATYDWTFDVFGNRLTEIPNISTDPSCGSHSTATFTYGSDSRLLSKAISSCMSNTYATDNAGNRLVEIDSVAGQQQPKTSLMSYTAANQLYFSMTPTSVVGTYDYNWHWYDGGGTRVVTVAWGGQSFNPGSMPGPSQGVWNYYIYDGSDVQLAFSKSGTTWSVWGRYLNGGTDQVLAGRYKGTGVENLALISGMNGTTLAAVKANGTVEANTVYYTRNAYGALEAAGGGSGGASTQTGFAGASTPNQTGGFVYLRNRWYDPQTGRFLTQDPIGLAGGVNLYAYAGNDPISYDDPFGLCPTRVGGDGKSESVDDCSQGVKDAWAKDHIHNTSSNNTDTKDVDSRLMDAVVRTSMAEGEDLGISAGKEEGHSQEGRHSEGGAVDINQVGGTRLSTMTDAKAAEVGDRVAAEIINRMPMGSLKMAFAPGLAIRKNRSMNAEQRKNLIAQHRSHVHVTINPE